MKIEYSILWFDDREDYFDSLDFSPLNNEILSWGFKPKLNCVTTPEEFSSYSPFNQFDLIVIDNNLEGCDDGQKFISDVRKHSIYTEIIFYTAGKASELWESIRAYELEGVFIASRPNIIEKIIAVGYQTIKKVLDLDNMRGLVMAEVGELDNLLEKIFDTGFDSLTVENKEIVINKFIKSVEDQHGNQLKLIDDFRSAPTPEKMRRLLDSSKRWRNLNRLIKYHLKLKARKNNVNNYEKEVLEPRNFLAHGLPRLEQDGSYLFSYNGKEFLFDEPSSRILRRQILFYKNEFEQILEHLSQ